MDITSWREVSQTENDPFSVTVLQLRGDLVAEEPLTGRARAAFADGARNIILDLSDVPFISSAGLRAIHALFMLLRDAGEKDAPQGIARGTYKSPHLKLVNPTRNGLKALSTAGYDMFLEIHHSTHAAVESFK